MARQRGPSLELEGLTESVTPMARPDAVPEEAVYTRCFLVSHPAYGVARVKGDDEAQAAAEFCRTRCPNHPIEMVREQLSLVELPFTPAATEVGKPGGWKRDRKVVSHAHG